MADISIKRKAGFGDFHRRVRPKLESEEPASGTSSGDDGDNSVEESSASSKSDDAEGEDEDEDVEVRHLCLLGLRPIRRRLTAETWCG
jgi:hypothetical protein